MVSPITVRFAPVSTYTLPTDAVIVHTPLTGTMTFPEYGDDMEPLQVTKGLEGEHPNPDADSEQSVTVSGIEAA